MARLFILFGSGLALLGVAAGAFGAHALSAYFKQFPHLEGTFDTAVRYHLLHAIALIGVAWLATEYPGSLTTWAGYLLITGVVIFSGSLYLLVLTRTSWLGAITPIGGVAFIAGWLCVFLAALRSG